MGTLLKVAISVVGCLAAKKVYDLWKDGGCDGVKRYASDILHRSDGASEGEEEWHG